jgi:hypothetical protein
MINRWSAKYKYVRYKKNKFIKKIKKLQIRHCYSKNNQKFLQLYHFYCDLPFFLVDI